MNNENRIWKDAVSATNGYAEHEKVRPHQVNNLFLIQDD
jgi:hypothetical protein